MEFTKFVRKPFLVEALEITPENIKECAEFIGTLRYKEDGSPYIEVDRILVPNVNQVYPGSFMTRIGNNVRCYSKKAFRQQFVESSEEVENWVSFLNENGHG